VVADNELRSPDIDPGVGYGSRPKGVMGLLAGIAALLLAGGILLDMDRINSVRESLDRVAHVAAFEAAAAKRPTDREQICQKRFAKTVWTDAEVSVDEIDVSVAKSSRGNTALVTYDATVQLVVGRFFGFSEVAISGEAEVTAPGIQVAAATP
jgi:uncharacterized membrane protein